MDLFPNENIPLFDFRFFLLKIENGKMIYEQKFSDLLEVLMRRWLSNQAKKSKDKQMPIKILFV